MPQKVRSRVRIMPPAKHGDTDTPFVIGRYSWDVYVRMTIVGLDNLRQSADVCHTVSSHTYTKHRHIHIQSDDRFRDIKCWLL